MAQSPKPVHVQPLCILCAIQDRRHNWGSRGYPVWAKVKGGKYDFGGRVYACHEHAAALREKAIAEKVYVLRGV